jgi:hypothetical protein
VKERKKERKRERDEGYLINQDEEGSESGRR